MADILELPPLDRAGSQRQVRFRALQGLHSGHLVRAYHPFPVLGQRWRLSIERTDILHLLVEVLLMGRRQPVADEMGLEVPLLSSRAA